MRALRRWFRELGYESDGVCGEVVPGGQASSGHGGVLIAWRTAEFSADRQHRARPGLAIFTEAAIQEAAGQRGLSAGSPHLMAARRFAGHRALYVQLRRRRGPHTERITGVMNVYLPPGGTSECRALLVVALRNFARRLSCPWIAPGDYNLAVSREGRAIPKDMSGAEKALQAAFGGGADSVGAPVSFVVDERAGPWTHHDEGRGAHAVIDHVFCSRELHGRTSGRKDRPLLFPGTTDGSYGKWAVADHVTLHARVSEGKLLCQGRKRRPPPRPPGEGDGAKQYAARASANFVAVIVDGLTRGFFGVTCELQT